MPRSKRNKVVSLTKTKPKSKDSKSKLIKDLRKYLDEYDHVVVFTYTNLKGTQFRDIRIHWRESKIFLGKNSIAQIAFGRTPEDEYKDNLRNVSELLEGDVGILFTNREIAEVLEFFKDYKTPEYAKAGEIAAETIVIPVGPLDLAPSMMDQLRKLGLIVEIEDSKLMLREVFTAARETTPLTPEQAKVLTHLGKQMAQFEIKIICSWSDGNFQNLA